MEKPHKKLDAWKLGIELVIDVYRLTKSFPGDERYSLSSQMRRAAVSVPSNLAEGAARNTKREFVNFLHIAQGSLSELDTHLEVVARLGYASTDKVEEIDARLNRIDKLVTGLIKALKTPHPSPLTPYQGKGKQ